MGKVTQLIDAFPSNTDSRDQVAPIFSRLIRQQLLALGSETPDNRNAVRHMHFRRLKMHDSGWIRYGLVVKGAGPYVDIVNILNALESCDVTEAMQEWLPGVTQGEIESALRVAVLIMCDLQHVRPTAKRRKSAPTKRP